MEKEFDFQRETEILLNMIHILECNKEDYAIAWRSGRAFTSFISSIVDELAKDMGMLHAAEYYTLDHVLYREEDIVKQEDLPNSTSKISGNWLKHIRVAIEHENSLDYGGGYQEMAKLMLFNADIKILMGYANKLDDYDAYARDYQCIYASRTESISVPIILIGEYGDLRFEAYLITKETLLKFSFDSSSWHEMN